jgi:hypothetical protein
MKKSIEAGVVEERIVFDFEQIGRTEPKGKSEDDKEEPPFVFAEKRA